MIALYPGAYKPPHKGHFTVVKRLLDGSHNGVVYDIDSYLEAGEKALKGDKRESTKVDKVVIFIGGNTRNGITPEHAEAIWNIYKKYLGNVEIVKGEKNPMFASSKYAKNNPNEKFYAIAGIRDEDDLVDLKRVTTFKNRDNVEGLVVSGDGVDQRASIIRGLTIAGNTRLRNYFPDEINDEEYRKILNIMKKSAIEENIDKSIQDTIENLFTEEVEEGHGMAAIAPRSVMKSSERAHLITLYNRIKNQIGDEYVDVEFKTDHIKVSLRDETSNSNFDFTPYMASILEYMMDQKMNILPLPDIKVKRDIKEAADFFGRTAYYNPDLKEMVIYVEGRHPKDIMRSFTHEMIHHIQNVEGRLGNINTTNTNESDELLELEKEAYTKGNLTFRNWEDKIKNENSNLNEGKYDSLVTKLAGFTLNAWKGDHDEKQRKGYFAVEVGPGKEFDYPHLDFKYRAQAIFDYNIKSVEGGTAYPQKPEVVVKFAINKNELPERWSTIAMELRNIIRHEITHLMQSGPNVKKGKEKASDSMRRAKLSKSPGPGYYKLEKEIDANLEGLYLQAKKSRQPLEKVIDNYLVDKLKLTPKEQELIKGIWKKRAPKLNIPYGE